jgi:hypothetical protein
MGREWMIPFCGFVLEVSIVAEEFLQALACHNPGTTRRAMHTAAVTAAVAVTIASVICLFSMRHMLGISNLLALVHRMLGGGCDRDRQRLLLWAVACVNDRSKRDCRHAQ